MSDQKLFYRFYTASDWVGDSDNVFSASVFLDVFIAIKETPKGYWIKKYGEHKYPWTKKRFVLKKSKRRYAYPTKEEAWNSYRIRAQKRIWYLRRQLAVASAALGFVDLEKQGSYKQICRISDTSFKGLKQCEKCPDEFVSEDENKKMCDDCSFYYSDDGQYTCSKIFMDGE